MAPTAKPLEQPLPPSSTRIIGIHQSDIIIRTAILAALADMRANPQLYDFALASLRRDLLTNKEYGERSIAEAKQWLQSVDIPVRMVPVLNELAAPCISITLVESTEVIQETTEGDVDADGIEYNTEYWPALTNQISPKSYNINTGTLILPSTPEGISVVPGMFIIDKNGQSHEILSTPNDTTFVVQPGTMADFKTVVFKSHRPSWGTTVESSSFKEVYRIGVHVDAEPVRLTWLHSLVVFILLRYKEVLLEGRGFERSTFSSTDFGRDQKVGEGELVFSRYINVTGYVRNYWPKYSGPVFDTVNVGVGVGGSGLLVGPTGIDEDLDETQMWNTTK